MREPDFDTRCRGRGMDPEEVRRHMVTAHPREAHVLLGGVNDARQLSGAAASVGSTFSVSPDGTEIAATIAATALMAAPR